MRRGNLAIDERIAPAFELPYQVHERHLGGVGFAAEHGFTEEGVTHGDAVQTADEFSFAPGFDGMGQPAFVQHTIGLNHLRRDPCAAGGIPGPRSRAVLHDIAEGGIEGDVEFFPSQCLAQTARDLQLRWKQHGARVR